ncbi:MAG: monofunctional biosynthetic peptidoglycan transglycosylase [Deltaproteobacteria bacterium]|nr:monofunctional biosynthetic peptidoglycan transglycosylase [Deltaproteobacteria bacterium]
MFKKIFIIMLAIAAAAGIWFGLWVQSLPDIENLKKQDTNLSITIKDAEGKSKEWIIGAKNHSWVPLNKTSPYLIAAVIASEDDAFFQHEGFDFGEIKDAIKTDIEKKRFARGASTITMQLAKNLYLTKEKTLTRKLKEVYLTYRLERVLTKKRILELYLNVVEWGPGVYGVDEASKYYFGKNPAELDLSEASILAVILPNPSYYNPYIRMTRVEKRQNYLLMRMLMEHDVKNEEYELAVSTPVMLNERL